MSNKLNIEQYNLLKRCAEEENFTAWNSYVENCEQPIKLRGANLEGITLENAKFINKNGEGADFNGAILDKSKLTGVNMSHCNFSEASLKNITAFSCSFTESSFISSNLDSSEFYLCYFVNTQIQRSTLKNVCYYDSNFYECNFSSSDLSGAKFYGGGRNPLAKKKLRFNLCGTIFSNCKFTYETYFQVAYVSRETDFRTIDFENARFSPGLKQEIQYCNRRHYWIDWYRDENLITTSLVKLFWNISDYGRSPKRVMVNFFMIAIFFAFIYYSFPILTSSQNSLSFIRSIYYSVVTMTTLGFGDIYANPDCWIGQVLTILQVLLGYVLLGALITVLSNLFISDGPPNGLIRHPKKRPVEMFFSNFRDIP
ncbi:pentapeptide repeat-containing protein [Aeromonas jandaei]|uniref:pentapeptide repeat-containing protein n=1 Tax=Aeromonas jandaei TaxID=650 RepID=UPI00227CA900|nr:pentapeptide repeat-containing protein [Aeromonas jandaei]WAG08206.1 pentapeptide repeat-containing protein [Aeromonas jandaei]